MRSLRQIERAHAVDEPGVRMAPIVLRPYACSAVQQRILVAIALLWRESGRSPSFVEVGWAASYQGIGGLHRTIAQLRDAGAVTKALGEHRHVHRTLKLHPRLCLAKLPEGYAIYEAIGRIERGAL